MFAFAVMPDGSNRVFSSLSTNTFSGTPYCKPSEIVSASPSITPESVEPSLDILIKISPGRPSSYMPTVMRSEEHTSELQSRLHLVCRLLLEKKKQITKQLDAESYIYSTVR